MGLLLGCNSVTHADDDFFSGKSAAWIEQKRIEALNQFEAKHFNESERAFYQVLSGDPAAHSATFALGYLKRIASESGAVKAAIDQFEVVKKASGTLELLENPDSEKFFKSVIDPGQLASHLLSLLKVGGILAARTSLLSVVLDGMGLSGPANFYFSRTEAVIAEVQKIAFTERREAFLHRPLQYVFPDFYERRIHLPLYNVAEVQMVPFEKEGLQYGEVQLKRSLDGWHPHLEAAFMRQYDGNPSLVQDAAHLAIGRTKMESQVHHFLLDLGAQGNVQKNPAFGWDYVFYVRSHLYADYRNFSTVTHLPSVWVSWWNGNNNEFRLRGDAAFIVHQADVTDEYSKTFGAQLFVAHLWDEKYRFEMAYAFHKNSEATLALSDDLNRDGTEHAFSLQFSYPSKSSRNQPFFKYSLIRNVTVGNSFDTITHAFEAGTCYLIGARAALKLTTGLSESLYPRLGGTRSDVLKALRGDLILPFLLDFMSFTAHAGYETQTSSMSPYSRLDLSLGLASSFAL